MSVAGIDVDVEPIQPLDHVESLDRLRERAKAIRRHVVTMTAQTGGHVGGALSCADILTVLFFRVLRTPPAVAPEDADEFILSAGHKAAAYYATLAERGVLPLEELKRYQLPGGILGGHPSKKIPGVPVSTGSLGHGLPVGAGLAYAARFDGRKRRIFVLMGDGETQEGSVWEAAMACSHLRLDNLVAVIDRNGLQIQGRTEDIIGLEPVARRWEAFGWAVRHVDGHDLAELAACLGSVPFEPGKPSLVLAKTVKGKGVSFMEGDFRWHYGKPSEDQLARALQELAGDDAERPLLTASAR